VVQGSTSAHSWCHYKKLLCKRRYGQCISLNCWDLPTRLHGVTGHHKDHSMNLKHSENLKCYNYKNLCSYQIHSKKVCAETCIDQHILKTWRHKEAAHNISRVRIWESTNCHLSLFVQTDSVMWHKQTVVLERAWLPDQLFG
jgi:hypothetical protein